MSRGRQCYRGTSVTCSPTPLTLCERRRWQRRQTPLWLHRRTVDVQSGPLVSRSYSVSLTLQYTYTLHLYTLTHTTYIYIHTLYIRGFIFDLPRCLADADADEASNSIGQSYCMSLRNLYILFYTRWQLAHATFVYIYIDIHTHYIHTL